MMLFKGEKVYDDGNYKTLLGDGTSTVAGGERRLLSATPRPKGHDSSGYAKAFTAEFPLIPRSEWSARLKEQAERKARVSDFCDFPPFDQNGLPTCWANGPCQAATIVRRIQGLPYKQISACSIAVPISGGHSGGWEGDALEYLVKHGGATTDVWANNDTSRSLNDKPEVIASRKLHMALESFDCGDNFDAWMTACLQGWPGGFAYNWMSHVMCTCDGVEIEPGSFGLRVRNSWGQWGAQNDLGQYGFNVYREGRGTPDSGFVLRQMTASAA